VLYTRKHFTFRDLLLLPTALAHRAAKCFLVKAYNSKIRFRAAFAIFITTSFRVGPAYHSLSAVQLMALPLSGSPLASRDCRLRQAAEFFVPMCRVFTALHGMQTRSYDEISVRLSVCPSVRPSVRLSNACIVTKRKKAMFRFLYHMKEHLS